MRNIIILGLAGAALSSLLCCAAKHKQPLNNNPGEHKYAHCHEVSWDVKNHTVTVICPLDEQPH